jgi:hypothetical protein
MSCVDVNTFLGGYPFRDLGEWKVETLLVEMKRFGITESWISWLPAVFWRDPAAGNPHLYVAARQEPRLRPVPAVHPGMPGWQEVVGDALAMHAPCIRCDPTFYGLSVGGAEMADLLALAGEQRLPLLMAVRLEDIRQRHPNDTTPELTPAMVRTLIRIHPRTRLIVTHADREFIEQVHFGATPDEASRILWDISCIWGPPEDHLETLLRTVGVSRFTFGTGTPLRLAETSIAKLDLLELPADQRLKIEAGNLRDFLA